MLQTFVYDNCPIQFEVIDGQVMANATLMAKAFGKKPDDIFRTKAWSEFENAVIEDISVRFEDIRTVKNGDSGGSWIHQELVIEFARRLDAKFALWCNRKISELLRTGTATLAQLTPAEMLLMQAQQLVNHERQMRELEQRQTETEAKVVEIVNNMQTRPNYFCVTAFCAHQSIRVNKETAKRIGRKSASLCKQRGYEIGAVTDDKWGKVGSYPSDVLMEVFQSEGLISKRLSMSIA